MNKIINDLLNTNARVIIPDFGAFIVKQKNPRLIVFNEFLRYNDGLLIDYIAATEQTDKDTAKARIAGFVEETNRKLSAGEGVILPGLGKLSKDSSGKLTFTEENNVASDEVKKEKKPVPDKEKISEPVQKESPESKKTGKQEKAKSEKEESKSEKKEELKPKEEKPVEFTFEKEESKPVSPKVESKLPDEKISVTPLHPKGTDKKDEKQIPSAETEKDLKITRKKNSMQIVIWIILIVVVNGAIIAWFLFNDQITGIFKKDKSQESQVTTSVDTDEALQSEREEINSPESTSEQSEESIHQVPQQYNKTTPETASTRSVAHESKAYYIVAGCFREESNADQLVVELKKKGFQAEKFGKIGNLHAVSFSSFADKSAALEELKKIRNTEQKEAWIVYY